MNFDDLGPFPMGEDPFPSSQETTQQEFLDGAVATRNRNRSLSSPGLYKPSNDNIIREAEPVDDSSVTKIIRSTTSTLPPKRAAEKITKQMKKINKKDKESKQTSESSTPDTSEEKKGGTPKFVTNRKLIRIKLPNGSYRTFPVHSETTIGYIVEKIKSKMAYEQAENAFIFQVNGKDEVRLEDQVLLGKHLETVPATSEFIFKKHGEKLIDRTEELKQIELENKILEKRKENIQEALSTWMGDSKVSLPTASTSFSAERIFFPAVPFGKNASRSEVEQMKLFAQADQISSFIIEKNSATRKYSQLKKTKGAKIQPGVIDFSSQFLILEEQNVTALSKISEVVSYAVVVSGWRCYMKEYFCHANDSTSTKKLLFEISLLENLPYHPNIIQYLYHEQREQSIQIFYASHGDSLRNFLQEYADENENSKLSLATIKAILLALCSGLSHLHSYRVVHNNLTSENVFIRYDKQNSQLIHLVIGQLYHAIQLETAQPATPLQSSSFCFTRFSPPETLSEQNPYIVQVSDIYSFGLICYELLTMKQPYLECDNKDLLKVMRNRDTKPKILLADPKYQPFVSLYNFCVNDAHEQRPNVLQLKKMVWDLPIEP